MISFTHKRTSFRNQFAPPILLQQLKGTPGQDSPCFTKASFYPAENGELEVFPQVVHVSKAILPGANGTDLQRGQECWPHDLVVRESLGVLAQGSLLRPSASAAGRDVLSLRHQTSAGPLACYWRRVRNSGKRRLPSVNRRFPSTRLVFVCPAGSESQTRIR